MHIELDKLQSIFQSAFGEPVEISVNTQKDDMEQWDSINHLNLIVELEDQLNVSFTANEIEQLNSVRQLMEIIKVK